MEEINLQGPLGNTDIRIINSYPSKVEGRKTSTNAKSLCFKSLQNSLKCL